MINFSIILSYLEFSSNSSQKQKVHTVSTFLKNTFSLTNITLPSSCFQLEKISPYTHPCSSAILVASTRLLADNLLRIDEMIQGKKVITITRTC